MPDIPTAEEIRQITDPRLRLIEAGARLMVDDGFLVLQSGISPDRVAKMAGRTRRTFYDHFDSKADFIRAVLDRYLDVSDHEVVNDTMTLLLEELIESTGGDLVASVGKIADLNFAAMLSSRATLVQTVAFSLGHNDPETLAKMREHFTAIDATFESAFNQIVKNWGRKMRAPWTTARYATLLRMLGDGLYLRRMLDPESVPEDIFSMLTITLLPVATQPADQPDQSLSEHLAAISDEAQLIWREQVDPTQITDARSRIMEGLDHVLKTHHNQEVTLEHVAQRSGVSMRTIAGVFGDMPALVAERLASVIPPWDSDVALDFSRDDMDTHQAMANQLERLATWALAHRDLLSANNRWPGDYHWSSNNAVVSQLISPLMSILQIGRERGDVSQRFDLRRISMLATHLAISAMLSRNDFEPEFFKTNVVDMMFLGLGAPENP